MISALLPSGQFFGRTRRLGKSERLEISLSRYASSERLPEHGHPNPYLSFVLHGSYVEHVGAREYFCGEHALLLHSAGEFHRDVFGPRGGACLNVELTGDWSDVLEDRTVHLARPVDLGLLPMLPILREWSSADSTSSFALEEAVISLLDLLGRACRERKAALASKAVSRALEVLEDGGHRTFDLPALAKVAGVHPTHLSRLFRTRLNRTITECLREIRLVKAEKVLLHRPEWSISQIAADLGFADHAHFSRAFKLRCGLTPTEFRIEGKRSIRRMLT